MNNVVSDAKFGGSPTPLITVAMPIHNGDAFLAKAIDSILGQTFSDFELIIIDDGSTDNSLQILREYQKCDARIRLIARENRNLANTLNDIIDLANGKWIARMDQDDIALPSRFERQLEWLEKTGADICGSWVRFFGTKDKRVFKRPQTDAAIMMDMLFSCPFAHPTVMMKTNLVKQLRYDKAWENCEDYDLWERASRAACKMTNVPEVLLLYRQHDAQISITTSAEQQQLTQKVRRRHWEFVFDSLKLNKKLICEILKLCELPLQKANMDDVDSVFIELLQHNSGEARATILDHAKRLYFRAAADCPDVAERWYKFNRRFGHGFALSTILTLKFLSVFRFDMESKVFQSFKKCYFFIHRN
jgi:glycosyltransferase involved in cell wall biosynthesis